jgi:hypothetical protein
MPRAMFRVEFMVNKRLIPCITALVMITSCGSLKQQRTLPELVGVYRATRSIEGALAVGVTYPEFGTLIRTFSTELLLARDRAKFDPEVSRGLAPVLDSYASLLMMYKDSSTVWGFELEKKTNEGLRTIAARYGVSSSVREDPRVIGSYHYKETIADYEIIRQAIWEQAGKLHEQQIAIGYGHPAERMKDK